MKKVLHLLLTGFVVLFVAGVTAIPAARADDDPVRVVVKGGGNDAKAKARLGRFYAKLEGVVAPQTLSEAYIECKNCMDLKDPGKVVTELNMWIQGDRVGASLGQIGTAFAKAAGRSPDGDPALRLIVDFEPPTDPACPFPGPLCKSRPFCQSMGGCSENAFPQPCRICDGVAGMTGAACGVSQASEP